MHHDQPAGERALSPPPTTEPAPPSSVEPALDTPLLEHLAQRSAEPAPPDRDRLRALFAQLAEALAALHANGTLHLDLRPDTVLLDPRGRVHLLPSARACPLLPPPRLHRDPAPLEPWSPYRAPELALDQSPSPAADWYAFGALLYQALCARPPHGEPPDESVELLVPLHAPDPRLLAPALPDDLSDLAVDLLHPAPERRPTGSAVLRAFALSPPAPCPPLAAWEARAPFLDRELALAALDDAFLAARSGATVTLFLHGSAGVGKSALLRRFLDRLAEQGHALVLEAPSRPHEGQSPLLDAVAAHLRALPPSERAPLLAPDLAHLLPLAPALAGVPALAALPPLPPLPAPPDPRERRRSALLALRALFTRVAHRDPLVLVVDAMDHASLDDAALLADLLEPGEHPHELPPPLLLLAAYESERASSVHLLQALRRRLARGEPVGDLRELLIDPFSTREARTLARLLLAAHASPDELTQLARASSGNPRLLHALVDRRASTPSPAAGAPPLLAPAPPSGEAPPLAPEPPLSLPALEQAAREASLALAFHRAAELAEQRVARTPDPELAARDALAQALALAGRPAEAAEVHRAAAELADPRGALDRRAEATHQLLAAARIPEALALAEPLLAALDLALPTTPTRALASLVLRRAQLSLRGLGARERDPAEHDPDDLARLDLAAPLARALAPIDPARATDLHTRLLLLALRTGEPARLARAFADEATVLATEGGPRAHERAAALLTRASDLAAPLDHPALHAHLAAQRAHLATLAQAYAEAVDFTEQAIPLLRASCPDATLSVASVRLRALFPALFALGRLRELSRRVLFALREAEQIGAFSHQIALRTGFMARAHLLADRPSEALLDAAEALRSAFPRGFYQAHVAELLARVHVHLYEGDPPRAAEALRNAWPSLERSLFLRAAPLRIELHASRALATAAASRWAASREPLLRVAERDARLLAKEQSPLATAFSHLAFAAAALARGRPERALPLYDRAEQAFSALRMKLHAAIARRRRGELIGGDAGRALIWSCDEWLLAEEVKCPDRVAAMIAPV